MQQPQFREQQFWQQEEEQEENVDDLKKARPGGGVSETKEDMVGRPPSLSTRSLPSWSQTTMTTPVQTPT